MNIKQLTYFSCVSKWQSYSKASKELYITQPTLCAAIHNLEKELGLSLFRTEGRNIVLTEDGIKLKEQADRMLEHYEDFEQRAYAIAHPNHGDVRVAVPSSLCKLAFLKPITEFCEIYPDIHLHFEVAGAARIQNRVLDGEVDCGFSMSPIHHDLQNTPILRDQLVVVAPSHWEKGNPGGNRLEDLAGERLILLGRESAVFQKLSRQMRERDLHPPIVIETPEADFALDLVRRGVGITIQAGKLMRSMNVTGISLYPLTDGDFSWDISLIYRSSGLSTVGRTFCNFMKRYYE